MRTVRRLVVIGVLGLIPGLIGAGTARAAGMTYYVNGTTGSDPGTVGACQTAPFKTIGAALACVAGDNTTASRADTVAVAAGTYNEVDISVNAYVTITGVPGATTVDGGGKGTVFTINSPYTATISGLTITGGAGEYCASCIPSADRGGGIVNFGTLTVSKSTLSNNTACIDIPCVGKGGAIYNGGVLRVNNSTISGNTGCYTYCDGVGGGIFGDWGSTLSISNSTFSANIACNGGWCGGFGGAVASVGAVSISDSTMSGNTACLGDSCWGFGGAAYNEGTLTVANSTVGGKTDAVGNVACNGNSCHGFGGAIDNDGSTAMLTNDTITFNAAMRGASGYGYGGALYNFAGPTLRNDTIENNTPDNCAPYSVAGCAG